ncbi:MliC family protein [Pseudorhodoplanes sp.]|uniref:MliC family protein n=1 Tax=Pseudorhodoplanes sp. TaxID=1934341 RepID=UPI00391DCB22
MKHIGLAAILALAAAPAYAPSAYAQVTFVTYRCIDGTQAVAAFYRGDKRMRLQFDGHSYTLPQRLSASGARYSKSGLSFWIKGQDATLKRPKQKATLCNVF